MELTLPWGGAVRPGQPAEVAIRLDSPSLAALELELTAPGVLTRVPFDVQADTPGVLHLPLVMNGSGPLRARASTAAGVVAEAMLVPRPVTPVQSVVAAAIGGAPPDLMPPDALWRPVGAAGMPRTQHGYGPVSVLLIGAATLAALDLRQASALEGYLAGCGRAVMVGLPHAAVAALRDGAGCAGAALWAGALRDAPALLRAALRAPPPAALPAGDVLDTLHAVDAHGANARDAVLLFLAAYAVLALLALLRAPRVVVMLPVLAALLALLVWHGAAPDLRLLAWSEQTAPGSARVVGRLQVLGAGTGLAALPLPDGVLALALPPGAWQESDAGMHGAGAARLRIQAHLLSRTSVDLVGTLTVRPALSLTLVAAGVQVRNPGPDSSPAAVLVWRSRALSVPALAPGARWTPGADTAAASGAAADLAVRRTRPDAAALLVRADALDLPGLEQRGWLLLRPQPTARKE